MYFLDSENTKVSIMIYLRKKDGLQSRMNDIESGRDSRRRKKTMLRKRNHSGTYIYSYGLGSTSSLIARSQQGATR